MKIFLLFFLLLTSIAFSQQTDTIDKSEGNKLRAFYANPGFKFETIDGKYRVRINFRVQFRGYINFDDDPTSATDFQNYQNGFNVNRARFKAGGNVYQKWMKYYLEYDLEGGNLLNFEFMLEKYSFLKLRVGQFKAQYSSERVTSSGRQQTIERSVVNRPFTIDRQRGISLYGNPHGSGSLNFSYWLSTFTGTGRGNTNNDDQHMMYMSRLQWNLNGRVLRFRSSDFDITEKFTSRIAIAAVTNRSKFTRFSTSGGGELEGFENAADGQYRVNQFLIETAFKYKGLSWQQEYHWKEINDEINPVPQTHLTGLYTQLGYMLHQSLNFFPEKLELYGRYAQYDPNRIISNDIQREYTFGSNYFFFGHNNKLSLEYSYLDYESIDGIADQSGSRFRIQWDISF